MSDIGLKEEFVEVLEHLEKRLRPLAELASRSTQVASRILFRVSKSSLYLSLPSKRQALRQVQCSSRSSY
jgi:hypothetical protein